MGSVFVLLAICLCKIKDRPCCQKMVGLGNQCFRSTQQRNLYHGQPAWPCKQVSHVEKPEQPILAVLLSHRTALLPEEKKTRRKKKGGKKGPEDKNRHSRGMECDPYCEKKVLEAIQRLYDCTALEGWLYVNRTAMGVLATRKCAMQPARRRWTWTRYTAKSLHASSTADLKV